MFLNYLKDTNKENFLKVCVHAALSNGVFAEKEKEALTAYCREMNVEVHIPKTQEASYSVNNLHKTDWNDFSSEERIATQNAILLVGLLYKMCQVNLVNKAKNENEINTINNTAIEGSINNADIVMGNLE